MKLDDAPAPGWYPDPDAPGRLRWWEGADWTDHYRARLTTTEAEVAARRIADAVDSSIPRAPGVRPDVVRQRSGDADEIVSQVRQATREEMTRAAEILSRQARTTVAQGQSMLMTYFEPILRWVRIAVVTVAVLVVVWFVLQFVAQFAFFEWVGDRIDNVIDNEE